MAIIFRFVCVGLIAGSAFGHDMWLEARSFVVDRVGEEILVRNGNGTIFRRSENAVTVNRIDRLVILDPAGMPLEIQTPVVEEPWLNIRFTPREEGNYWVGLATKPSKIRLTGSEFTEYLEHDGIPSILSERRKKGISSRDEIEQYSKHVKACFQVGEDDSANYAVPLGLVIEIIPQRSLYRFKPGESLPVQVLLHGKALAGITLHAGFDGTSESTVKVLTDGGGRAEIPISSPGRWYVRGIHLVQVDRDDHSYESHWVTLTFQVEQ